jgi:hypothetical protein
MIHRLFGQVKPEKKPKANSEAAKIAFFELMLTQTNAGVHKPLLEGYTYSLFKPRQPKKRRGFLGA